MSASGFRRYRGLAFIAGHLLTAALIYIAAFEPFADALRAQDETLAGKRELLQRLRASLDEVRVSAAQPQQAMADDDFLSGASDGAVSAALQSRLRAAAEAASVSFRSVRALSPQKLESLQVVSARIEVTGATPALRKFVHSLESARPPLFLASAIMRAAQNIRPNGDGESLIEAQYDVFAPVVERGAK